MKLFPLHTTATRLLTGFGLVLFFFMSVLFACKKEPPRLGVAGLVKEFGTDLPIPNATVYGIDCEGEPLGPITCFASDSTKADIQGYYSMSKEPGWVLAIAPGYWKPDQVPVLHEKELRTHISLHPYAWLKVTIQNESGAYGFFPPQDGSGGPPVQLVAGSDTTFALDLRKGNDMTKYIFSIRAEENGPFPDSIYWQGVKAFANGIPIDLKIGAGAFLDFYLAGHDTTNLVIKY